jgi:hypothetical protein
MKASLAFVAVVAVAGALVAAAAAEPAAGKNAAVEELYLGDFSLDPESDNRKTPAKAAAAKAAAMPSYPACISLCSSQKRAMRRSELAARKSRTGARIVGLNGKLDSIKTLEAKEKQIQQRLKELRRQKRAASHRKLLTIENTDADDDRADRLAEFAKADSDKKEAGKIRRLLQERKKLLGYLVPDESKLATKQDDSFQKRLNSLPFAVAGETDCVTSCKQARKAPTGRKPTASMKGVKTHMLPTSSDPPFTYQGGHDDCDAGGMMVRLCMCV